MNDWVGLLIVIVVIIVVWWLLARFAKQKPQAFDVNHEAEAMHANIVETPQRMESVAVPSASAQPDNLVILEGIGPKVNTLLQAQGIKTFAQLSATEVSRLKSILEANGLQFMDPSSWPQQAKLAAEGKMDELQMLMGSLKGGRSV